MISRRDFVQLGSLWTLGSLIVGAPIAEFLPRELNDLVPAAIGVVGAALIAPFVLYGWKFLVRSRAGVLEAELYRVKVENADLRNRLSAFQGEQDATRALLIELATEAQAIKQTSLNSVDDLSNLSARHQALRTRLHNELKEAMSGKEPWWMRIVEPVDLTSVPLDSGWNHEHRCMRFEAGHWYDRLMRLTEAEYKPRNRYFA